MQKSDRVVIILSGGHKGSQERDIRKCLKIMKQFMGEAKHENDVT